MILAKCLMLSALPLIAVSLFASVTLADGPEVTPPPVGQGDIEQDLMECDAPCPGYTYQVAYSLSDGEIIALVGYDQSLPGAPKPTAFVPREGESYIDITGHPGLLDISKNVGRYRVDLDNVQVEKKPQAVWQSILPDVPDLSMLLFAVALAGIAGSAILPHLKRQ